MSSDADRERERLYVFARVTQAGIDWDKYPKLREIFERRPAENVYWAELILLIEDAINLGNGSLAFRGRR